MPMLKARRYLEELEQYCSEILVAYCLGEDDIVRFEDRYGRVDKDG